jgi:hypothetical protein
MSLHNEIMNIQGKPEQHEFRFSHAIAYKTGHRDARHAAAEMALKKDALIEKLLDALEARNADDYVERIRKEYSL